MNSFEEGYKFFVENASALTASQSSNVYINSINTEIDKLVNDLNSLEGFTTASNVLKGDVAEFWHGGTFNIAAALKASKDRVKVERVNGFASVDISSNFGIKFGLKYYSDGQASAKAQSVSIFQRFKEYQSKGGSDSLEEFLSKRGYTDFDKILNDPIYSGQIRVIPSDQLDVAIKWLEKMIKLESSRRPEQVYRYQETLSLLKDRLSNAKGVESIPLSREEAEKLAALAKQGKISANDLGLTTEELMGFEYVLQQAFKAGVSAATISLVLKIAPEIFKAIEHLVNEGQIDIDDFKKIGFAALSGSAEGFIRGSISATLTTCCKAGLLGVTLKSIDPSVIGAITVIAMNVLKNSVYVVAGKKSRQELTDELLRDMYVSACSLIAGGISQSIIEVPIIGYMIGSFIGSIIGSFTYNVGYNAVLSFCVETGFTMFGLVEQDYTLPKDVMEQLGIETFDYESFEYKTFETKSFEVKGFKQKTFEQKSLDIVYLRRGVIGVRRIGYI